MTICFKELRSGLNFNMIFVPHCRSRAGAPNDTLDGQQRLCIPFAPEYSQLDLNPRCAISHANLVHSTAGPVSGPVLSNWTCSLLFEALALSGAKIPKEFLGITTDSEDKRSRLAPLLEHICKNFFVWWRYGALAAPMTIDVLLTVHLAARGGGFADEGSTPVYPGFNSFDARKDFFKEIFAMPAFSFDFKNQGRKFSVGDVFCEHVYNIVQYQLRPQRIWLSVKDIDEAIEKGEDAFNPLPLPSQGCFQVKDVLKLRPTITGKAPIAARAAFGRHIAHFAEQGQIIIIHRCLPSLEFNCFRRLIPLDVHDRIAKHEMYFSELGNQTYHLRLPKTTFGFPYETPMWREPPQRRNDLIC